MATEPKKTTRRRRPAKKDGPAKANAPTKAAPVEEQETVPVELKEPAPAPEPKPEPKPAPERKPVKAAEPAIPEGQRKPMDFTKMKPMGMTADTSRPVPPGMTRYLVKLALGGPDGRTYIKGEVVDLYDEEARYFNRHNAIGLWLGDGGEAPESLPKPVRIKRRDASKHQGGPTTLPDSATLEVDATL